MSSSWQQSEPSGLAEAEPLSGALIEHGAGAPQGGAHLTVPVVPLPDEAARDSAARRQAQLTKPPGSLGRLEMLALQLAAWQGASFPSVRPAAALIFAADHPVTRHGVCPYPSAVTRAMVDNFASGGAAVSVLCSGMGIPLTVVDVGVSSGTTIPREYPGATLVRDPVSEQRAGDIWCEDAMTDEAFSASVEAGRAAVRRLTPRPRCLVLGEMGIGNTTAAAAVCAALLGGPTEAFVGAGTGSLGDQLERKRTVVREAVARVVGNDGGRPRPLEALRRLGGREIAALYGAMVEATQERIPIVVDGYIVTTAALVLIEQVTAAKAGMIFAHRSDEAAHGTVLEHLGVSPLLNLGMRLGEASGALVAFPIVEQACRLHERMATFASANVPEPG